MSPKPFKMSLTAGRMKYFSLRYGTGGLSNRTILKTRLKITKKDKKIVSDLGNLDMI